MILRRIAQHVKDQNWTAIGIDFVIVVLGVFMGIQLGNWNERLNDRQRAEDYLARLTQEMTINLKAFEGRQASYASQIEYGLFVMDASEAPSDREAAWEIIRAFFQASHAFTITPQRGTYDEIISSGDLALLGDQELVNALSRFYTFGGFSTIEVIPPYRESIRRLIPFQMQEYLQTQCYRVDILDNHSLLDCPPPDDAESLVDLATQLQADTELKRDLQYMLSYAGVSVDIATNRAKRAHEVLAILSTQTGSTGD
ncbi:MAG: hypothetical protein KDA53_04355 [Hyphomonas sp.]|nr:hypothetical protein [Hyphomonas sp.]